MVSQLSSADRATTPSQQVFVVELITPSRVRWSGYSLSDFLMWNALLEINLAITQYEQTIFVLLSHHQKYTLYFSPFNFLVPALG